MTEPQDRPAAVFHARVDRRDGAFHARCGVGDPAGADPATEWSESDGLASYDDARAWVHLSAGQAGFRRIAWDPDTCPAPDEAPTG